MKSRFYSIVAILLTGALALPSATGCGGDQPPPKSPSTAEAVVRAPIFVAAGKGPEAAKLAERLVVALSRAGYEVVASEGSNPVLTVDIAVNLRESQSLLQVSVNGKVKQNYIAEATIRVHGGSQVLSGERIEYDVSDGPSDENMRSLLLAIRSPGVQAHLQRRRQQESDLLREQQKKVQEQQAAQAREQREAREQQQRVDDAAWNQIVVAECAAPVQLTGCDGVKQYLAQFPNGAHAVYAKKALESGVPAIAKLTDERDWSSSRAESCKAPKTSSDCDGILAYTNAQPGGVHIVEARQVLAQSEATITALRKTEEQRAKANEEKARQDADKAEQAQLQAERRLAREQCKKDCIGGTCFNLRPGVFEICLDRCVKANCD